MKGITNIGKYREIILRKKYGDLYQMDQFLRNDYGWFHFIDGFYEGRLNYGEMYERLRLAYLIGYETVESVRV